jgi:hypothetical protein
VKNKLSTLVSLSNELRTVDAPVGTDAADYRIAADLGPGFLARSKSGSVALLVPMISVPAVPGRRGGGFSLSALQRVAFEHSGRRWEEAAAAVECTETALMDTFLVLVVDIARRLSELRTPIGWPAVLTCVDEWQSLLARRTTMTTEQQLGLWAELWMMAISSAPDRLFAGWRGPEGGATDFVLGGAGAELKASRQRHVHHVSQVQAGAPIGELDAYVVSAWAGIDPEQGRSVGEVVDELLQRVSDAPALLKQLARVGYVPMDREHYTTRFTLLETPSWFRADELPRVRQVDPGVSQVRYIATLDPDRALSGDEADRLWHHFCGVRPTMVRTAVAKP